MRNGGNASNTSVEVVPSQTVVEMVAREEGVSPEKLCPPQYESLHDVVDPEALDSLFAETIRGDDRGPGSIAFTFCGYDITVDADGTVEVE